MDILRNAFGDTYFSVPRRKRLSSEEMRQVFIDIEAAELDAYRWFVTYKPLGMYVVQNLHGLLNTNSEMTPELEAKFFAWEQSFYYPEINQQELIDSVLPQMRLLDAPRDWGKHMLDVVAAPEALRDLEEFTSESFLDEPEYLDWAREARKKWRRVLRIKNEFIQHNQGLVGVLVKKYYARSNKSSVRDLQQEGCFGLIRAVDKFDYKKEYQFSTYANWWIRHAVTRAVQDKERVVRVPVHVCEKTQKLRQCQARYYQLHGVPPPVEWLEKESGVDRNLFTEYLSTAAPVYSLDAKMETSEGDGEDFLSRLVDDRVEDPSIKLSMDENRMALFKAMKSLNKREMAIIRMRFGFDRGPQEDSTFTLNEIGEKYELSRERIRQVEAEALSKLRRALGNKLKTMSLD